MEIFQKKSFVDTIYEYLNSTRKPTTYKHIAITGIITNTTAKSSKQFISYILIFVSIKVIP